MDVSMQTCRLPQLRDMTATIALEDITIGVLGRTHAQILELSYELTRRDNGPS